MTKIIKGFKGFDKGLVCRGFKYEVGKEYKQDDKPQLCNTGFHFCENPLDVLSFYPLTTSQFAQVEALGSVDKDDTKIATDHIRIVASPELPAFIKASVDFIYAKASKKKLFKKSNATAGEYAHSATAGEYAHSATAGEYAHSATAGNRANSATAGEYAHSATKGESTIACSIGRYAAAKASLGSWIVLAEWFEGGSLEDVKPISVQSVKVDGKKIKADTWYKLQDGKFVETTV